MRQRCSVSTSNAGHLWRMSQRVGHPAADHSEGDTEHHIDCLRIKRRPSWNGRHNFCHYDGQLQCFSSRDVCQKSASTSMRTGDMEWFRVLCCHCKEQLHCYC